MNKKKISIKPVLELRDAEKKIDEWITEGLDNNNKQLRPLEPSIKSTKNVAISRFTVIMPEYLHRRIKKYCAVQGLPMKDKIIEILEKEFPET